MAEDSRKNIERLLKLPPNVANIFHELDVTHSFPLAKAFALWLKEHDQGAQDAAAAAHKLATINRNSKEIQQFMREVGHGLLDALKARANVMPGLINKAKTLHDVAAAIGKYQKRDEVSDKVIVQMPDGFYWVRLDSCEHAREGEEMQHCASDSRGDLVSFRDPKGQPHVTMTYNAGSNSIFQIKGKQNREPEKKYWPGIEAFFEKTKAKLKDRYVSDDLKGILAQHAQRVIAADAGNGMVWVELSDGFYGLVSSHGWEKATADKAIVTMSSEEYRENSIKEIKVNKQMTAGQFLKLTVPFLTKLKAQLSIDKIPAGSIEAGGEDLNAELFKLTNDKLLVHKNREVKVVAADAPLVVRIGSTRYLYRDLTAFFEQRDMGSLLGISTVEGLIVNEIKDGKEPATSIADLDGETLTKALLLGNIFGFERDSTAGGRPISELIPKTFETECVSSE